MNPANKRAPALSDDSIMYFGKHKGERMEDVPAEYLLWLSNQDWIDEHTKLANHIWNVQDAIEQDTGERIGIK